MSFSFKKNIFFARASAKKAIAKAKNTVKNNARSTIEEVSNDIEPELRKIKTNLSRAAGNLKKDLIKKVS
jgi:hypothetical protein